MGYIIINLLVAVAFVYSCNLSSNKEPKESKIEENKPYEPNGNKTIQEYERDIEVHNSWETWGIRPLKK